jgi:CubicO group peptidase (beta-lactamase class C family)
MGCLNQFHNVILAQSGKGAHVHPGEKESSMRPRKAVLTAAAVLLGLLLLPAQAPGAEPKEQAALDALVDEAVQAWGLPGLAVAVVRDDEVIYLCGAGVREVGKKDPVTADTQFAIGSCTKAFTATAIGLLVEDGKAGWDDPVRKHVPFFQLSDPLADRDVTLRDLLCHRTGLSRHDMLWYHASWPVEESVRRIAHLKPAAQFRSEFLYNNLAYLTVGLAIGSAAGMPWQEFVQQRLLDPLGMKSTVFTRSALLNSPDHAMPHRRSGKGDNEPFPWWDDDRQIRASGSMKSSIRDLAQWVRLQLGEGKVAGKQVVPRRILAETHTPQIVVPLTGERERLVGTTQMSYALGWNISDYRGRLLLEHGGAVDGFRARILLLPKDHVGIVLLTNIEEGGIVQATGNMLLDHLLKAPRHDWHRAYLDRRKEAEESQVRRAKDLEKDRVKGTKPSHDLDAYTGTFRDPAYGEMRLTREEGRLMLAWSSFRARLAHYHYDTFLVEDDSRVGGELLVFSLTASGDVGGLRFLGRDFRRGK